MRKLVVLCAVTAACAWSQGIDFSSLDKLDSKASEVNRVSLDENQLRAAMDMAKQAGKEKDLDEAKKMMAGLQSVNVRNYEFKEAGAYTDADLEPIRAQIAKQRGCSKIVDSKEKDERSEIYMCMEDGKTSGIAVIDAEPKELSIVFVKGPLNMKDLGKLHGVMGLPNIQLGPGGRESRKGAEN
jgi:Domain of unknown function (DUF4252)